MMKLLEQVYPVEAPEPQGLLPTVKLRPYQKQSLAFMLDIEQTKKDSSLVGRRHSGTAVRGGWLCDEMVGRARRSRASSRTPRWLNRTGRAQGMGKTMVCISLILANPLTPSPGDDRKKTTASCPRPPFGLESNPLHASARR